MATGAVKLNAMVEEDPSAAAAFDKEETAHLQRAAEAQKRRTPFERQGGWPTPHGQPWDQREIYERNVDAKPWMVGFSSRLDL